jgi:hypothetical protein
MLRRGRSLKRSRRMKRIPVKNPKSRKPAPGHPWVKGSYEAMLRRKELEAERASGKSKNDEPVPPKPQQES